MINEHVKNRSNTPVMRLRSTAMRRIEFFRPVRISLFGLLLMTSGCSTVQDYSLTYKLWNYPELRRFAEPAADPHLALFVRRQNDEVLVQYDEITEQSDAVRRRAYFLRQYAERTDQHKKPAFINPKLATNLDSIPLSDTHLTTTNLAASAPSLVATSRKGSHGFSLLHDGTMEGPYELPVYLVSNGNFIRVTLTPIALTGDTIMVGLVASVVAAY